jgi:hypothetical protein
MAKTTKPDAEKSKDKNLTILVTSEFREKVDEARKVFFPDMQLNQFLAYLVRIGLEEEEIRNKEKEYRNLTRIKQGACDG